jgi:hypothetical protein
VSASSGRSPRARARRPAARRRLPQATSARSQPAHQKQARSTEPAWRPAPQGRTRWSRTRWSRAPGQMPEASLALPWDAWPDVGPACAGLCSRWSDRRPGPRCFRCQRWNRTSRVRSSSRRSTPHLRTAGRSSSREAALRSALPGRKSRSRSRHLRSSPTPGTGPLPARPGTACGSRMLRARGPPGGVAPAVCRPVSHHPP